MDKGLEKIQELKSQIEELDNELMNIFSITYPTKLHELSELENKNQKLNEKKKDALYESIDYEYKEKYIKKWKRQTIVRTGICLIATLGVIMAGVDIILSGLAGQIGFSIYGLISIPLSIKIGEAHNYYSVKKYLESTSQEQLENTVDYYIQEIELNNKKQCEVTKALEEIKNSKKEINAKIEELRKEIKKIKNIRSEVISSFITCNQELDNLLSAAYEESCKTNKEFTIKKQP